MEGESLLSPWCTVAPYLGLFYILNNQQDPGSHQPEKVIPVSCPSNQVLLNRVRSTRKGYFC